MVNIICIGGGVGPMAGVDLHKKIINNTKATSDKDHLNVFHFSFSSYIEDRTEFLKGNVLTNPAIGMFETIQYLYESFNHEEEYGTKKVVLGIPCNTFHAPQIFDFFIDLLVLYSINIQVVNMIDETIYFIKEKHFNIKNIGLLSTTGTRDFNVYDQKINNHSLNITKLPDDLQEKLHRAIYSTTYGIKAKSNPVSPQAISDIKLCADYLIAHGAEVIVLGCTELPLVFSEKKYRSYPIIDTVDVLAKALIREVVDS